MLRRALFSSSASAPAAVGSVRPVTLISSWFCPFAQRAWVALNYRGIPYEWVEALDWHLDGSYRKHPLLLEHNPRGLIPTILGPEEEEEDEAGAAARRGGASKEKRKRRAVVFESSVCVEWADDYRAAHDTAAHAAATTGSPSSSSSSSSPSSSSSSSSRVAPSVSSSSDGLFGAVRGDVVGGRDAAAKNPPLLPADAYLRSRCRLDVAWVNSALCSPYYGVLVRTGGGERRAHFESLLTALRAFGEKLQPMGPAAAAGAAGPLWGGSHTLTAVDVALIPWACRYHALAHYRGPDFAIPSEAEDPSLGPYHRWAKRALSDPAVLPTIPDTQRYLAHVSKYADGSAKSKVGDAVRAGRPAHDLDV